MKNRQHERTLHLKPENLTSGPYHLITVHLYRNPLNSLGLCLPICKVEAVILFFPFESLWKSTEIIDLWFVHHHSGCMWEILAIPVCVSESPCLPAKSPNMSCSARDSAWSLVWSREGDLCWCLNAMSISGKPWGRLGLNTHLSFEEQKGVFPVWLHLWCIKKYG